MKYTRISNEINYIFPTNTRQTFWKQAYKVFDCRCWFSHDIAADLLPLRYLFRTESRKSRRSNEKEFTTVVGTEYTRSRWRTSPYTDYVEDENTSNVFIYFPRKRLKFRSWTLWRRNVVRVIKNVKNDNDWLAHRGRHFM